MSFLCWKWFKKTRLQTIFTIYIIFTCATNLSGKYKHCEHEWMFTWSSVWNINTVSMMDVYVIICLKYKHCEHGWMFTWSSVWNINTEHGWLFTWSCLKYKHCEHGWMFTWSSVWNINTVSMDGCLRDHVWNINTVSMDGCLRDHLFGLAIHCVRIKELGI